MLGRDRTLVIAHRGAWAGAPEAPENTLTAFATAIELGADMIELDVRQTRDGCLIAYHDARVRGIRTRTLRRDQITAKRGSGPPPLLEEVLALAAGRIGLDVELKERGYVGRVVELLRAFGLDGCLVTSFLDDVVVEVKRLAPELRTGLLLATHSRQPMTARASRAGADCLALARPLARAPTLRRAAAAGIPCLVWTVNDVRGIDHYLGNDAIAGVITDRPALALERRSRLSGRTARAGRR